LAFAAVALAFAVGFAFASEGGPWNLFGIQ
jgi:hypothetical protein